MYLGSRPSREESPREQTNFFRFSETAVFLPLSVSHSDDFKISNYVLLRVYFVFRGLIRFTVNHAEIPTRTFIYILFTYYLSATEITDIIDIVERRFYSY